MAKNKIQILRDDKGKFHLIDEKGNRREVSLRELQQLKAKEREEEEKEAERKRALAIAQTAP